MKLSTKKTTELHGAIAEERPILFSGPMVRAIMECRKTQTRRPLKPQPDEMAGGPGVFMADRTPAPLIPLRSPRGKEKWPVSIECPYGKPGDRLWVRETWALDTSEGPGSTVHGPMVHECVVYRADGDEGIYRWNPPIHMPREFSRLTLEITNVRVERIQEINGDDYWAEGMEFMEYQPPRARFIESWNTIYPSSWDRNDWVWVIEFRRELR